MFGSTPFHNVCLAFNLTKYEAVYKYLKLHSIAESGNFKLNQNSTDGTFDFSLWFGL